MNKIVCYLLLIFLLAGCATYPTIPTVKEYQEVLPDEALVFGRFETNHRFTPIIFLKQDGLLKDNGHGLNNDYFYWRLKPGKYIVTRYTIGNLIGRIWFTFEVPIGARVVYIGTLQIHGKHGESGRRFTVNVEDNFDTAIEILKKKFSLTEVSVSKSIMKKEEMSK